MNNEFKIIKDRVWGQVSDKIWDQLSDHTSNRALDKMFNQVRLPQVWRQVLEKVMILERVSILERNPIRNQLSIIYSFI